MSSIVNTIRGMDPREWEAAEWSAFGQVGALAIAVIAGLLVWMQVSQGRQVREDQTRPYVILDFEFRVWEVVIAIRNIGTTPARDVRFEFDKPLSGTRGSSPDELAIFASGIPMLAPGRTILIPLGHGPDFFSDSADEHVPPLSYTVKASYSDLERRRRYHDPPLILDLTPFEHTLVDRDDLHQIYQNLKDIKNLMKSWTSERRLRVNTVTQDEVNERNRLWREARRAQEWERIRNEPGTELDGNS